MTKPANRAPVRLATVFAIDALGFKRQFAWLECFTADECRAAYTAANDSLVRLIEEVSGSLDTPQTADFWSDAISRFAFQDPVTWHVVNRGVVRTLDGMTSRYGWLSQISRNDRRSVAMLAAEVDATEGEYEKLGGS